MNHELCKKANNKGYIALMSVIIISAILLLVASTLNFSGFSARYNILDSEYKEISFYLAEACVESALLRLTVDPLYAGGLPLVDVASGNQCEIRPHNPAADPIVIQTKASFQKAVTNLEVKVNKSDLSVVSWQELPTF